MKRLLLVPLALVALSTGWFHSTAQASTPSGHSPVGLTVGRLLEQHHYNQQKLDEELGRQILVNYLEHLDPSRLYFTQKDVDDILAKYGQNIDSRILQGNLKLATEIYDLYRKRVEERLAMVKTWISTEKFDFKSDRTLVINREKSKWPKDQAEAEQLWRDRIENEFLSDKLSKVSTGDPKKRITKRYDEFLKDVREQNDQFAINEFLSVFAHTYDPHTDYLSKEDLEEFKIGMELMLYGIGAVLQSDEGYAKILELVPGGPALSGGQLKVGDRIAAVAQGNDEFVDTVDMKLNRVVRMIRGKKGTTVRLQVVPVDANDPSERKIISIVREAVKIKDKEAKANLIEKKDANGNLVRYGVITLPSFYADMDNGEKSTTDDVLRLLNRLKKENISGLIIDLRNNGGGSLEEAVRMAGLFIRKGPVVQVKNANGTIRPLVDRDAGIAYDGPMLVLTNTLSASASEIFAGALQDYGRAIVVGDRHTFGKGTVQTLLYLDRFMSFLSGASRDAGALKLTIQKFYRIAGGSTQLLGVTSDIVLPSVYDQDEIGEKALKNPLPHDEVPPARYERVGDISPYLEELRERSRKRVGGDPEFKYVQENMNQLRKRLADNKVSLNEKVRRAEIKREKDRRSAMKELRAKRKPAETKMYEFTLDNVDKPDLQLVSNKLTDEEKAKIAARKSDDDVEEEIDDVKVDPIRDEAVRILTDYITLSLPSTTAAVSGSPEKKAVIAD